MKALGRKVFTGTMQLVGGWEIRPFAVKVAGGLFAPGLSKRRHEPGSVGTVLALDRVCTSKEEAFEIALAQGRGLCQA